MDRNGNGCYPKDLEDEGISSRQEVLKGRGQIFGGDASVESENKRVDELSDANAFNGAEEEISKTQQLDACSFDMIDDQKTSSDVGSTHGVDYQMTNSLQQSSVLEITQSKESSVSSSPRARKVLDHCVTAPVRTCKNLLSQSHEIAFSRSMTEKRESPWPDLKLDRLSEAEKENLIANLVKIQNDGTVEVDLTKNSRVASELLELRSFEGPPSNIDFITSDFNKSVPKLKIAMLVVGTRGDIQTFLAVAKRLQEFGHQVRLATHINFSTFVKSAGIDFYPLGGDPRILAGYMAKNKGLIPSAPGEISIQRKELKAIIESLLPACTEPDTESGEPFRAQSIIANPPAYGHTHVAEALGVPLHILFTMPWTPTYEFPHPLARVPQSAGYWLSYIVVDLLIWWGIRGYINDFRKRKLKLDPIAYFSLYNGSISHLPTAYMWSPNVMPKPSDWGPQVDVVGYCFLNLGSKYQPPIEFAQWIQKGHQPIYIGFGSMPLEDPKKTTDIILEALTNTGQRGIIDRGWGNLGTLPEIPDSVFPLVDCPHDWLFPQCLAVVHHGGAGTTATGIRAGCPTTIVPFFGDQFFWGDRIHEKGLGPAPIPISELTIEALSDAIKFMLQSEVKARAMEIAKLIENEDGVAAAVDAFHRHLPPEIPLPRSLSQEDDHPGPLQWLFIQIGKLCCLPCGS
ncbi:Sterol 3-beta-glucosyltransferase [Actinidia chinensis var. chinensis]|uniref:Sterol 3-beta-glucosyltransferase n=2 Tax=Actinidia TaxID=3624 RepID=A0A2R6R2R7_ACTCC|nr:Sterol 3-beta-glucosyltransferase [Actinidia chinensis var. chinensis]